MGAFFYTFIIAAFYLNENVFLDWPAILFLGGITTLKQRNIVKIGSAFLAHAASFLVKGAITNFLNQFDSSCIKAAKIYEGYHTHAPMIDPSLVPWREDILDISKSDIGYSLRYCLTQKANQIVIETEFIKDKDMLYVILENVSFMKLRGK